MTTIDVTEAFWPFVDAVLTMPWDAVQAHPAYEFLRDALEFGWRIHAAVVDPSVSRATDPADVYEGDDPAMFFKTLIERAPEAETKAKLQACLTRMERICHVIDIDELFEGMTICRVETSAAR